MHNHWLARFSDMPALIAPEHHVRFEACINELAFAEQSNADVQAAFAVKSEGPDAFWTELGERGSKMLRPYIVQDGVLLLPVKGVLLHDFPYQFFSYATGYEYIWKAFERGQVDPDVLGIALVIESPGGEVAGNFDLVDKMFEMRGNKPVRAFAHEFAYSAAYSIASVADEIIVSRTGGVGSIGVVTAHIDLSKAFEDRGIKVTFIHFGKHKVDGNPYEALPADVKARLQDRIDTLGAVLVDTVARNRTLDAAAVRDTEALTYTADQAIEIGLADRKGALDAALAEFQADVTNPQEGDETMTTLTVASVRADHADIANALIAEGKDAGKAEAEASNKTAVTSAGTDATTAERTRMTKLDGLSKTYGGNAKAAEIITAAKADGSSYEATAVKLLEAGVTVQAQVLSAIQQDDKTAQGAAPAAPGAGGANVPQTAAGWKAEWEASAALQGQYPKVEQYVAFKNAEAKGQVRILEGRAGK
jgi:signal peptide peptidase SppA